MDVLQELGKVALGSRLRRLGDVMAGDAARIYDMYQVGLQPKWFPSFYLLSKVGESSIMAMAKSIGCSHPVVSQVVKEMAKAGLVETASGEDARVNVVRLSDKGRALVPLLGAQMDDVLLAVEELLGQMGSDLWRAIEEVEFLLEEQSMYDRVRQKRKERRARDVEIIDGTPELFGDFKRLNCEWIEKYFELEEADLKLLDHAKEKIIDPGGCIIFARLDGEIVGTCALRKADDENFELVKMAVTPKAQGRNIGWLLGAAILEKARALGARRIYIESNTRLKAAMKLYAKLGFSRFTGPPSPYDKCNIQLEKYLDEPRGEIRE